MAEEEIDSNKSLAEGVAYFEKMLEIMPDDRPRLEFLVVAYEQLGEQEKCEEVLARLARLLIKEDDLEALEGLMPRLEAAKSSSAQAMVLRAKAHIQPKKDLSSETLLSSENKEETYRLRALLAERNLARELKEAGVISESDEKLVVSHFDALPDDGRVFLISTLSVLQKENEQLAEKALAFVANKMKAPPVPIDAFEVRNDFYDKVPPLLMRVRGVVPFAKMGDVTLVAALNPDGVRDAVNAACGKSHLFTTSPQVMEKWLNEHFEGS